MKRRPSRILALAIVASIVPGAAQAAPQTILWFAPPEGSAYHEYLKTLTEEATKRLGPGYEFEFQASVGSVENYNEVGLPGRAAIALVQEDVAAGKGRLGRATARRVRHIRALARPMTEYVFVVAPEGIESLDDVKRMSIGAKASGSAFTFHRLSVTWNALHPVRELLVQPDRERGFLWELKPGAPLELACEAAFLVSMTPDRLLKAGDFHLLSLDPGLQNRILLDNEGYRAHELPDPQAPGETITTIAVDTLLIASTSLPVEVAEVLIDIVAEQKGIDLGEVEETDDKQPLVFQSMPLPEHNALIRAKMGRYPYLGLILVTLFALLLFSIHVFLTKSGWYYERARAIVRTEERSRILTRRFQYAVGVLLVVIAWTLAASGLIKYVEARPLLEGTAVDDSGLWQMDLQEMLTWMLVLVSMGNDQAVFPVTQQGRLLAVSVQIGSWTGLVWLFGSVLIGVLEDLVKRVMKLEVQLRVKDHLVICNWNAAAEVIIRECRDAAKVRHEAAMPVVIIGEELDDAVTGRYADVHFVQGSALDRATLLRACVPNAAAVVVLADGSEPLTSDARCAMIAMEVNVATCARTGEAEARVFAEVLDETSGRDMATIGVYDVGSEDQFEVALLAQASLTPRISHFYDAVLDFAEDSVELYSIPVPPALHGRPVEFATVVTETFRASRVGNPQIAVGVLANGRGKARLNPRSDAAKLRALGPDDCLLVLAWEKPDLALAARHGRAIGTSEELSAMHRAKSSKPRPDLEESIPDGDMRGHVVVLNWSEQGARVLHEIHQARSVGRRARAVIVTDKPVHFGNAANFPDVTVIPMSPHTPGALTRTSMATARSVLILADRESPKPDSRTLLLGLRIERLLRGQLMGYRPNVVAEVVDPQHADYIRKSGVDEAICATETLYRVFAQAVTNPAVVPIFQDLLRFSSDTNEVYLTRTPECLEGATYLQAFEWYAQSRSEKNPALLMGYRLPSDRGNTLVLNPRKEQLNEILTADHRMLVMQWVWTP